MCVHSSMTTKCGEGHYENEKRVTQARTEKLTNEAIKPNIKKNLQHKVEFQSEHSDEVKKKKYTARSDVCAPPPRFNEVEICLRNAR